MKKTTTTTTTTKSQQKQRHVAANPIDSRRRMPPDNCTKSVGMQTYLNQHERVDALTFTCDGVR
jgi:hypothetical protein